MDLRAVVYEHLERWGDKARGDIKDTDALLDDLRMDGDDYAMSFIPELEKRLGFKALSEDWSRVVTVADVISVVQHELNSPPGVPRMADPRVHVEDGRLARFVTGFGGVVLLIGFGAVAAYVGSRIPLVKWRGTDEFAVAVVVLGGALWFSVMSRRVNGSTLWKTFVFGALTIGSIVIALLLIANALPDEASPTVFKGVVARISWSRGTTYSRIVGAPVLPDSVDTLIFSSLLSGGPAKLGDTVAIVVKPGFLGRPWIASVGALNQSRHLNNRSTMRVPEPRPGH